MAAKVRVQKRLYYKIGEACKALGIQPYVLRYWETEFPALTPSKSRSGQRVYSEKELEIIRRIKELLYEEGYTIAGAKKKLEGELAAGSLGEPETDEPDEETAAEAAAPEPPPAAPAKPPAKPRAAAPAPKPEPPSGVDTDAAERVQRLLSGIEEALQEAREILTLLRSKSP
ncbi:MAG TPA: MerR family transcriptional regulator [Thermoanaerobaculia bacterium]|jgi:DNA-binding transcriptional MerR regulator